MKNQRAHMVLMNGVGAICTAFTALISVGRLSAGNGYVTWLLYLFEIASPVMYMIVSLLEVTGVISYENRIDEALETLMVWEIPILVASAKRVLPLIGNLFTRSWVLGLVCGAVLAISILLCLGINIAIIGDWCEKIASRKMKSMVLSGLLVAFVIFLLRSIWLYQGELNDYPLVVLSALYALSTIPAINASIYF